MARSIVGALVGYNVMYSPESGDKVSRAGPLAAQAAAGTVRMLRGDWNKKTLDELAGFPYGTHDDIVDGLTGAFNRLALARRLTAYVL